MTQNNPQVPWTDEQWARVNQVIQEEASRARVAATFLPLIGPLPGDTDFVRAETISYLQEKENSAAVLAKIKAADQELANAGTIELAKAAQNRKDDAQAAALGRQKLEIEDKTTIQLATLQVKVEVRGAQLADPEMTSVLALFRRAANVLARLEDAVVFNGLKQDGTRLLPQKAFGGLPPIWEIRSGDPKAHALFGQSNPVKVPLTGKHDSDGELLVSKISDSIGMLEGNGHFGPFAVVLDPKLFLIAQTPGSRSMVLPQDRILPFLGGGSLLRSSSVPLGEGVVVALGGAPVELVIATDVSLQFLAVTNEPKHLFRVFEKMLLRIKESDAIVRLEASGLLAAAAGGANDGKGDEPPKA